MDAFLDALRRLSMDVDSVTTLLRTVQRNILLKPAEVRGTLGAGLSNVQMRHPLGRPVRGGFIAWQDSNAASLVLDKPGADAGEFVYVMATTTPVTDINFLALVY